MFFFQATKEEMLPHAVIVAYVVLKYHVFIVILAPCNNNLTSEKKNKHYCSFQQKQIPTASIFDLSVQITQRCYKLIQQVMCLVQKSTTE